MRLRVHRRRRGFGLAAATRVGGDPRFGQGLDHFTAQGLELRVRDEVRLRRVQLDVDGVVLRGTQLAEQILQLLQRLFRLVRGTERAGQGDAGADALFTGSGQFQLFFTQASDPAQCDATLGGGLLQRLLPVVIEIAIQRMVGA
ncbi:hypothetical protein D3C87_1101970 [compost metagenome]